VRVAALVLNLFGGAPIAQLGLFGAVVQG